MPLNTTNNASKFKKKSKEKEASIQRRHSKILELRMLVSQTTKMQSKVFSKVQKFFKESMVKEVKVP